MTVNILLVVQHTDDPCYPRIRTSVIQMHLVHMLEVNLQDRNPFRHLGPRTGHISCNLAAITPQQHKQSTLDLSNQALRAKTDAVKETSIFRGGRRGLFEAVDYSCLLVVWACALFVLYTVHKLKHRGSPPTRFSQ